VDSNSSTVIEAKELMTVVRLLRLVVGISSATKDDLLDLVIGFFVLLHSVNSVLPPNDALRTFDIIIMNGME
jgi:hypothetical protein